MGGVLRNQQENTCNFDRLQSGEGLSLKVLLKSVPANIFGIIMILKVIRAQKPKTTGQP